MDTEKRQTRSIKWWRKWWLWLGLVLLILVVGGISTAYWLQHRNQPPTPALSSAAKQLDFDIYYPDQKKLPVGYNFNLNSVSTGGGALVYSVSFDQNKKFIFSIQQKPSATDISGFYTAHIPLHSNQSTSLGTAAIGVIGSEAVISLPTNTNAWILITAPLNTNQGQILRLLNSLVMVK